MLIYCYETRWETLTDMEYRTGMRFETYQWKIDKWTNKPWLFKHDSKGVWFLPLNIKDENKVDGAMQYARFLTKASRLLLVISFAWFFIALNLYLKEKP